VDGITRLLFLGVGTSVKIGCGPETVLAVPLPDGSGPDDEVELPYRWLKELENRFVGKGLLETFEVGEGGTSGALRGADVDSGAKGGGCVGNWIPPADVGDDATRVLRLAPVEESGGIDGGLESVLLGVPDPLVVDKGTLRSEDPETGGPIDPDAMVGDLNSGLCMTESLGLLESARPWLPTPTALSC
jgi:hypothetical protein